MTKFYHVLIKIRGEREDLLLWDLSQSALKQKFLKPYRSGKKIPVSGKIIDPHALESVRIIMTNECRNEAMERLMTESILSTNKINENNRGAYFIGSIYGSNTDIEHAGTEVTKEFIIDAPGSAKTIGYYINHPWVLTVLGGLIVAILVALVMGES